MWASASRFELGRASSRIGQRGLAERGQPRAGPRPTGRHRRGDAPVLDAAAQAVENASPFEALQEGVGVRRDQPDGQRADRERGEPPAAAAQTTGQPQGEDHREGPGHGAGTGLGQHDPQGDQRHRDQRQAAARDAPLAEPRDQVGEPAEAISRAAQGCPQPRAESGDEEGAQVGSGFTNGVRGRPDRGVEDLALGQVRERQQQLAVGLIGLSFSREHETEADMASVNYLCGTEYNAAGAAGFFRKMEGQPSPPVFLSTHPNPNNRVKKIDEEKIKLTCSGGQTYNSKYVQMKNLLPK